jgi:hypothetical protein
MMRTIIPYHFLSQSRGVYTAITGYNNRCCSMYLLLVDFALELVTFNVASQ